MYTKNGCASNLGPIWQIFTDIFQDWKQWSCDLLQSHGLELTLCRTMHTAQSRHTNIILIPKAYLNISSPYQQLLEFRPIHLMTYTVQYISFMYVVWWRGRRPNICFEMWWEFKEFVGRYCKVIVGKSLSLSSVKTHLRHFLTITLNLDLKSGFL